MRVSGNVLFHLLELFMHNNTEACKGHSRCDLIREK